MAKKKLQNVSVMSGKRLRLLSSFNDLSFDIIFWTLTSAKKNVNGLDLISVGTAQMSIIKVRG